MSAGTPTTDWLADQWWELLERAPGGEEDGFLTLGGTSWAAVRLRTLVRTACGVEIPLTLLLGDNGSLAALRAQVAAGAATTAAAAVTAADDGPPRPVRRRSRLAPAQRRMWMFGRLHPDSPAYNVVAALRLSGDLDVPALRAALADLVERHDALRASVVGDEPELVYADRVRPGLRVRTVDGPLGQAAADDFVRTVAERPIPFSEAPMWTAALLHAPGARDAVLALSAHHMIADQHAMDLLLADLAAAYAARIVGGVPSWPAPAPRFADHAEAQADAVAGPRWAADLAHWQARLADAPRDSSLPLLRPVADRPSFAGQAHRRPLGRERSERLAAFARDHAVTPVVLVLGCVAFVLAAWSGRSDVVLGMPASRRREPGDEALVGFLVESLPVRLDLTGQEDFGALLRHTRDRQVEALEHATPTFDAIVEALDVPTRPTGNPLFRIWVNDLTAASPAPAMPRLDTDLIDVPGTAALFDVNVYLRRDDAGYRLDLIRAVDRLPAELAEELADQYLAVLDQVLARPDIPLAEIDLVTGRGRAAGADLALPLAAPAPPPPGSSLVRQVLDAAARHPQAPALLAADGTAFSYRWLAEQVAALAERLRADGVRQGSVVAVEAVRGAWLPVALLAAWQLGAVPAPLDAALPELRLAACHEVLRPVRTVRLSADAHRPPQLLAGAERPRTLPGVGHVLFTSGTSGRPAAVAVPRGVLESALAHYGEAYAVRSSDRTVLLSGLGHDPVLRDLFVPLRAGGTVVLPPDEAFKRPVELLDLLHGRGVSLLHATPALLGLLTAAHAERPTLRLDRLRLVMSGGAPLTGDKVRGLRALTRAAVVNAYGATETPQIASEYLVAARFAPLPDGLADEAVLPAGSGAAGSRLVVVTPGGDPAGIGRRGEILVRSHLLAAGYLDGSGPAERFGPDPGAEPGAAAYRTGDLGRLDAFGRVHVDGRADRQVSVNGYRVGLEEVESAARRHAGVLRAAAAQTADGRLALWVVPRAGAAPTEAALRRHLSAWLPPLAVPSMLALAADLAMDANHKVVVPAAVPPGSRPSEVPGPPPTPRPPRGAPAPYPTGHEGAGSGVPALLAERLRTFTGRDVGPDENFFDIGLDSVTLLRLHESLRREPTIRLSVTDLFAHPSSRELLRFLSGQGAGDDRLPHRSTGAAADLHAAGDRRRAIRRRIHHEG
ncbi:condensation domain-containing protein [Kitasatospora sp. NPDC056651]|uniref:condensation domain-containing protein n=1 Tax=Kitasatospora sp. NPDC056651 TaxID=3345892 RepID=UPI0036C6515E